MPRAGPRKVQRYSLEFKLKAVKVSQLKGIGVQGVANALEINPFMRCASAKRPAAASCWAACRSRRP